MPERIVPMEQLLAAREVVAVELVLAVTERFSSPFSRASVGAPLRTLALFSALALTVGASTEAALDLGARAIVAASK